ncbi:DUF4253 domain-containing protein [Dactylosporangium sp. CA-092794]|uniref:DUF4253 domain-containing protein n=1 Tax=Dactylosporangium sp. CA-092794 TaxID=3239929 RepID=UPI003D8EC3CB
MGADQTGRYQRRHPGGRRRLFTMLRAALNETTAKFSAVLRSWEGRFGVRVLQIDSSSLTVSVAALPADVDAGLHLAAEHFAVSRGRNGLPVTRSESSKIAFPLARTGRSGDPPAGPPR